MAEHPVVSRADWEEGTRTLAELFDGRRQLLVYHFMFGPSYEAGCPTCSSMADGVAGVIEHLDARDATFLFVSQAPLETLQAYRRRMGWGFRWPSAGGSDFNIDLGISRSELEFRALVAPILESGTPPILEHMTRQTGTDVVSYSTTDRPCRPS